MSSNKKQSVNTGTIGHVDHGKSTTTACIKNIADAENRKRQSATPSGNVSFVDLKEIDRTKEEQERGITINLTTVQYETEHRVFAHVDCPGHSDYVKNMITGAAKMNVALLVVDGGDGVKPQTREHIKLARILNIPSIVLCINKCDVCGLDNAEIAKMEADELLEEYGYKDCPYIFYSAKLALDESKTGNYSELGGQAVVKLLELIDKIELPDIQARENSPFRAIVEEVIPIRVGKEKKVQAYVVTTRVDQGNVKVGDTIPFIDRNGQKKNVIVFSMEAFKQKIDKAGPNDNIGMVLKGAETKDLARGVILGEMSLTKEFKDGILYLYGAEEGGRKNPIGEGYRPHGYSGVIASPVTIKGVTDCPHKDEKRVYPGETATVTLISDKLLPSQGSIILRDGTATVGVFKPKI